MVISHAHRYLFIELPQTGSSAISRELCQRYEGQRILKKHATYRDFLRIASAEEKKYFVLSGIRNPMDKVLSLYFKYKTDHSKAERHGLGYDDPKRYRESNMFIAWLMRRQYAYVRNNDADFADFFRRYYRLPYDDWSCLDHPRLDFVIHFENLAEEFEQALHKLGIKPERPLPLRNKTGGRDRNFWSYYTSDVQRHAMWVFGPYFRRWGYRFPEDWPREDPTSSELAFRSANVVRKVYWKYIR